MKAGGKNRVDSLGGLSVFLALALSSGLAYTWPWFEQSWDPFRLTSTWLLSLVALTMFCLGVVARSAELVELRRRPWTVFAGVIVQCTLMPALAWVVVRALAIEGQLAYGVLLAGCVPGAMASNVLTMTAKGNVSYSVSLTTIATLISPITVPFAFAVVAGLETEEDAFNPRKMATTLVLTVVLPVISGFLAKHYLGLVRRLVGKVAGHIATIALLWIIASVVAVNRERLSLVAPSLIAGLLAMNLVGYLGGYAMGLAVRMREPMRRALTLEVGMQNAGLGTALAASLLGDATPAQIPTAAYTFGCMLTGTILAAAWSTRTPNTESAAETASLKSS